MTKLKFLLYKSNKRKDGSYPVCMRITKKSKVKYVDLKLSATVEQWNEEAERFKKDKRVNPNHEKQNALLNHYEERKNTLLQQFAERRINWTINQFEAEFLGMSKQGKVYDYFMKQINNLKATGHIGNSIIYNSALRDLIKFDKKIKERVFSEIDIKYVNKLNMFMEKNGCCGNTRKICLKTIRAVMNKAIKEKEAPQETYPFGANGLEINRLAEETTKRYLLAQELELIKNSPQEKFIREFARRIFLLSYHCLGISFVDMAHLTYKNIELLENGEYIVYKRKKTQNNKEAKSIRIPITDALMEQLDWFKNNNIIYGDYLLPIITEECNGEQLYRHIRGKYRVINNNLKKLGKELGVHLKLTTYVSRHTMAMTLQNKKVAREIISQVLGHSDLSTTNTYLDSFDTSVIDEAASLL